MSVLINGIEMPDQCGSCPCFHAEHPIYCQAVKADKDKRIAAPYGLPRPDWCPIVEVPPHGRLIDADAIALKDGPYEYDEWCEWALRQYQDAPTIIEAEEET